MPSVAIKGEHWPDIGQLCFSAMCFLNWIVLRASGMDFKVKGPRNTEKYCRPPQLTRKWRGEGGHAHQPPVVARPGSDIILFNTSKSSLKVTNPLKVCDVTQFSKKSQKIWPKLIKKTLEKSGNFIFQIIGHPGQSPKYALAKFHNPEVATVGVL